MARTLEWDARQSAMSLQWRAGVEPMPEKLLQQHQPQAHLLRLDDAGLVAARCSLWTEHGPSLQGQRTGILGHYAAADEEQGEALLRDAAAWLTSRGFTIVVGPMDGNTWRRYRLLTWRGDEPTFFLEPDNPDTWPAHFLAAGFAPLAEYTSAINSDLSQTDPRLPAAEARLSRAGISIRHVDVSRFEAELRAIHQMSLVAFAENFLYTPIDEQSFVEQYLPIQPYVQPEFVLIAEMPRDAGDPISGQQVAGFLFAIPDLHQRKRNQPVDTLIIKTLAVLPGRRCAGLGSVLLAKCHQIAQHLGFHRAIHALMHESNVSKNVSGKTSHTMRRYTLYARKLAP